MPVLTFSKERLLSLDAYRGLIMLTLISRGFGLGVLKDYPGWEWLARQVDHVDWQGVVFWDLIQPAFTFMVGIAMPLALERRKQQGAAFGELFKHVAWRAFALIVLSNVLSNFGSGAAYPKLQLINVLSQIAFGYLLCFFVLQLRFRLQVAAAVAMLGLHWGLFAAFPGPDGPFSKQGNIGAVIDLAVLGYNYSGYYTTLNFVGNAVTILFGCWCGLLFLEPVTDAVKLRILTVCACAALIAGLALDPVNPMVKRLWTASFTLFSGGWVIAILALLYWIVEICNIRRWTFPVIVLGMNSLFIYSFSQVLYGWLDRGLAVFSMRFAFLGALGAIPQSLLVFAAMWYLCYWLYQRQIFFKL